MTTGEEPPPTEPVDVGDATQPVELNAETGPFARTTPPSRPVPLVSPTAANMLLADAMPATTAPEPAVPDPTTGLDSLFADSQFRAYENEPTPEPPALPPAPPPAAIVIEEPPHMTRAHRVLLALAGSLVALIALGALFFLGTRLAGFTETPRATPTPTTRHTPTPAPTVLPPGPIANGPHRWDQLLGGECLARYPGPWAQRYTVVDCASPHPAQLVYRGRFADPAAPGYPGADVLASQLSVLCSKPDVIGLAAAAAYRDAQIEASYPVSAKQWDAGDHWYYCFVSRSSRDPLTGSVAVPHAASPSATG